MNRIEILSTIIEAFEDFLDEKGIVIDNPEKDEFSCNIYGDDFGNLSDRIETILTDYGMMEGE